jgi:hypothetical protein
MADAEDSVKAAREKVGFMRASFSWKRGINRFRSSSSVGSPPVSKSSTVASSTSDNLYLK